ncbi:adhesion G protein-coupled receptor E5 isoform X5 [Lutra lutra]|uniref:adhesion G protein-coupled receptor E5 isoform X5 n=1 Tax=Lutra lutra TaxID=9657 RepID=UPI001FD5287E|nr:adhesion G protein-coupled receptor E5 isoform X5 [Lutra lutra]
MEPYWVQALCQGLQRCKWTGVLPRELTVWRGCGQTVSELPRQFRGGSWASLCPPPPPPLHKVPASQPRDTTQLPSLGRLDSPAYALPPQPAVQTMGGPRRCSFLLLLQVLGIFLILLEAGSQKTSDCARWCPPNSTCVNATACRCSPGFSSSSGVIFTSLLESCDDINECRSLSAVSCGKFADCQNTEGSYYCTCIPGYELPSGARMFKNESENRCQDVDECQQKPRICKSRGICTNTQGSYTCECPPGLQLNPGDPNLCTDVNECTSGQNPCHSSTHCLNNIGGYKCRCRPGWKPIPGSPDGPNNTVCEDVDECSSEQPMCHESTICINTVGSYKCRCRRGWELKPGFQNKQPNTTCEEMSFPNWTPPPGKKTQSMSHFFERVQRLRRDFKPALAPDTMKDLIQLMDTMLETPRDLETLSLTERHCMATDYLLGLETVLRMLAKAMPGASFTYVSPSDTELSLMIQEHGDGDGNITIGQSHARMLLNWDVATGAKDSGPTVMGILSSWNMRNLLANASLKLETEKKVELSKIHQSTVHGAQAEIVSAVSLVFLSNTNTEKLDSPVTFSHRQEETPGPRQELICAFWKSDNRSGHWATTGCRTLGTRNGSTTCQCNHLSSFAILMAHYDIEDPKLALITKVGLAVSLVCLLLCILTFLLVRPIQGSRTTVHLHLCICLFVGSAIFLAGIENKEGSIQKVGLRCRLVAGLLHYFFLAAFCWMSLEGVELYFLVVRVFQGQGLSKWQLCLIGYGVPLLIVGVSAAVKSDGYGRNNYCWLNPEGGFLWSFVGPVTLIVLCNAVIFVTTVWKLTQKFSEINPDLKKLKKARVLTITAMAQLFVLGCTWGFGFFLFNPQSWLLSYTFTILNCLQGFFLFVLHCLLNKKVREEYRRWAGRVTGNKYSEFTTSMTGTSHNQTQAHKPSESGM